MKFDCTLTRLLRKLDYHQNQLEISLHSSIVVTADFKERIPVKSAVLQDQLITNSNIISLTTKRK